MPSRPTFEERFWSRVDKTDDCWLWTGSKNLRGYGSCKQQGRMRGTHRIAYELSKGAIPEGLELDHLCRVRHCVNPAHLEPVSRRENNIRSEGFAGVNHRKTQCVNGHEFTEANTYTRPDGGGRACRACHAARQRRRKEASRGAQA